MRLKNRIKKITSQIIGTSEFCECPETPKFETVYHENGKPATSPELIKDNSAPIPETCGLCGKPVQKTILILDFTDTPTGSKAV